MSQFFYNPHHDGSALYYSESNPALGKKVTLRIAVHESWKCSRVLLRQSDSGEAFLVAAELVETRGRWQWYQAQLRMANPLVNYRWFIEKSDGNSQWLNATGVHSIDRPDSEDFRIAVSQPSPEWATGAVMYQIFPDRFSRSHEANQRPTPDWALSAKWDEEVIGEGPGTGEQFFGGDLKGIANKLDYLASLGVEIIYLTPFFPARSNHRYDASSFDEVDPLLGGNQALADLVQAAHEKGFKVMGDLTSNHSGSAHEWFIEASKNPESVERNFYYFNKDGSYESWFGVPSLPKFNWQSSELRKRFIKNSDSVVAEWLQKPYELDGWRIDVANMTGRFRDQDMFQEIGSEIRERMNDINPDTLLMAEYTSDASMQVTGQSWQSAMTYSNFSKPVLRWLARADAETEQTHLGPGPLGISGQQVAETYQAFIAAFPWAVRLHNMNALDTHDTPRFKSLALPGMQKIGAAMQFTIPGIPTIFAGDELGLSGWNGESSRTPMPWEGERKTDSELTDFYKQLITLRKSNEVLKTGSMRWIYASPETLIFTRENEQHSMLICASRRGELGIEVPVDALVQTGSNQNLLGGKNLEASGGRYQIDLVAGDIQIWRIRAD